MEASFGQWEPIEASGGQFWPMKKAPEGPNSAKPPLFLLPDARWGPVSGASAYNDMHLRVLCICLFTMSNSDGPCPA